MAKVMKVVVMCCLSFALVGCSALNQTNSLNDISNTKLEQMSAPSEETDMAIITTSIGQITMILYNEYAPNAVDNFKKLVEEGFYDKKPVVGINEDYKTVFAGASDKKGSSGKVADGKPIDPEISNKVWHFSGAVSSCGDEVGIGESTRVLSDSRFFIVGSSEVRTELVEQMEKYGYPQNVIDSYKKLGGCPELTGRYTVFGQVVEGLDVVDKIIDMLITQSYEDVIMIESIELGTYVP